jgi:hypothetical protein
VTSLRQRVLDELQRRNWFRMLLAAGAYADGGVKAFATGAGTVGGSEGLSSKVVADD